MKGPIKEQNSTFRLSTFRIYFQNPVMFFTEGKATFFYELCAGSDVAAISAAHALFPNLTVQRVQQQISAQWIDLA